MSVPLRIAVVSTPRSGNTWFRRLLQAVYCIPDVAVHEMTDADWESLPPEVALQLHWPRTPEFVERLSRHGFRVLTLARHPLDVLISILHFSWYDPTTANWLKGEGGNENALRAAMPRSRTFVDYCTGPRASALLNVTADWWGRPGVVGLRYEDAVADTRAACELLFSHFGPPRCGDLAAAVESCSLAAARRESRNNHFWKGQPGLWRELLPAAEANEILTAVRPACERLGYDADPDPQVTAGTADAAWVRYTGQELINTMRRNLDGYQTLSVQHHTLSERHHALNEGFHALHQQHRGLGDQHHALSERLHALSERHRTVTAELHTLTGSHDALRAAHDSLGRDHHGLSQRHDTLSREHHGLSQEHDSLSRDHHGLSQEHDALSRQHHDLSHQHDTLSRDHHQLSQQHHELNERHNALHAKWAALTREQEQTAAESADRLAQLEDARRQLDDLRQQHHALSQQHHALSQQHHETATQNEERRQQLEKLTAKHRRYAGWLGPVWWVCGGVMAVVRVFRKPA